MKNNPAEYEIDNISGPQSLVMDFEKNENNQQDNNSPSQNSEGSEPHAHESEESNNDQEIYNNESDSSLKNHSDKRRNSRKREREEKYQLSQALAEERKRNLQLENYLGLALNGHTRSNITQAAQALEAAERAHAEALGSGDAIAAAKASTALIQANLNLERTVHQAEVYDNEEKDFSNINPTAFAATNLLNDWLMENPELDRDSGKFNLDLLGLVAPVIDKLDAKLKRQGQAHLISSPVYFELLDTIVSKVKSGRNYDRPMAAPVNSRNYNRGPASSGKLVLTEAQKKVAAGCNMSEEQYATWLKKYEQERIEKENNRGSYGY